MDEAGKKRLWDDYDRTKSPEIREKIILEYAPLVKLVAGRLSMYLGYNVEYEDLVSYGIFGLIDAIDKFDNMKEVKFETYASLRIRGAILDQIRKMDWIPRTIRQKQKRIEAVMKEIELLNGREATDEEIALKLGITEEEYLDWQSQMKITNVVSLNEYMEQGSEVPLEGNRHNTARFEGPEESIEREELKKLSYLADKGVLSNDDIAEHKAILEKLRGQVDGCEENIKAAKAERDKLTDYYDTYNQQVQCDYDFLLEKAREEQERKAQAVQINEEEHEQERKTYYEK